MLTDEYKQWLEDTITETTKRAPVCITITQIIMLMEQAYLKGKQDATKGKDNG